MKGKSTWVFNAQHWHVLFLFFFFKENVELPGELYIWKAISAYAHVCVTQQFLSAVQTDNTSARSNCSSIESSRAITLLTKLFSLLAFWYLCDIKLTWTDNIIPPAELLHRPCNCSLALVGSPSSLCVRASGRTVLQNPSLWTARAVPAVAVPQGSCICEWGAPAQL